MKPVKKLSTPLIASIGAAVLVFVLFLSYLFSSGLLHARGTGIVLPEASEHAPVVSAGSQLLTAQSVADVEIGIDNAQKVIASLVRPAEYSYKVENTLHFAGGSSSLYCRRYTKRGMTRIDTLNASGSVQSTLLRGDENAYAWNAGENNAFEGKWGDFSDDAAAMLPTYEDVLGTDIQISDAGKQDVDFEPCIRVQFEQGGYRCVYYISAASGLLKTASFYSGDMLVRQVTVSELKTEPPDEALFALPNGDSVLGE